RAGLKIIGFCDEAQPLAANGKSVIGCQELYDLANIKCDQYNHFYLLSGMSYLTNNGLFTHNYITSLFRKPDGDLKDKASIGKLIHDNSINVQNVLDAAYCWNS